MPSANVVCSVCNAETRPLMAVHARSLRPEIRAALRRPHSSPLVDDDPVCRKCVLEARSAVILQRLASQRGTLSALEKEVAEKAASHETVASHIEAQLGGRTTRGQRLADAVARVGGSWAFVGGFLLVLAAWMALNSVALAGRAFDPYPFILLNLVLSCVAALQAPIIMMSQNRASARDRMQADQDFRVNLKAEIEVAGLHEKIDYLLHEQWESLLVVQQAQLDLLTDLTEQLGGLRRSSNPPPPVG